MVRVSKRRSRLVRMPTSFVPTVTGTPLIRNFAISASASATGASGRHGDRVHDHARLRALDLVDLGRLGLDRHVLVDEAEPALLGQGDREVGLGHGVHRRRDDRDLAARSSASAGSSTSTCDGSTSDRWGTSSTSSKVSASVPSSIIHHSRQVAVRHPAAVVSNGARGAPVKSAPVALLVLLAAAAGAGVVAADLRPLAADGLHLVGPARASRGCAALGEGGRRRRRVVERQVARPRSARRRRPARARGRAPRRGGASARGRRPRLSGVGLRRGLGLATGW